VSDHPDNCGGAERCSQCSQEGFDDWKRANDIPVETSK
jgi:hypothetical protein